MRKALHVPALLLAFAVGCARSSSDSDWVTPAAAVEPGGTPLHIVGVMRHRDVEGGFWAIEGEDGISYDPGNLPESFQKEGLLVEAYVRRRDDRAGIHMSGPIVDIVRIRAR